MLLEGRVGPQNPVIGNDVVARFDRNAGLMVSQLRPQYAEMALTGRLFMANLQSVVALSTLSATCTGFCLTNPNGSGKNIALLVVSVALASAPGGISSVHIAYGAKSTTAVTQTTPLTVRSGLLEAYTGVGLAASATTLPAVPTAIRAIGGGPVATGSVETSAMMTDIIDGAIIIPPGSSVSLGYVTTAISVVAGMTWLELDA